IFAYLVETDFQGIGVDGNAQVAVILIVVMFQDQAFGSDGRFLIHVTDVRAVVRLLGGLALGGLHQLIHVVAAIAADDEWDFVGLARKLHHAREPLIVVGVAGKNRVGVNALCLADGVDVAQHRRAAAVVSAGALTAGRW